MNHNLVFMVNKKMIEICKCGHNKVVHIFDTYECLNLGQECDCKLFQMG